MTSFKAAGGRLEPFRDTVDFIARTQEASGAIPWFTDGELDPWNHVEAAMGLALGGRLEEAAAAYAWLQRHQLEDGGWFAGYCKGRPTTERVESNFVAYVATGVWHYYLNSRDEQCARELWPMVRRALDFVLRMQGPAGEIYWALDEEGKLFRDALLTGCCSIYKSLGCGIQLAGLLGLPAPEWAAAQRRLGEAILQHPEVFDRSWESKAAYAMDWYYPVLCGLLPPARAKVRLNRDWQRFVVEDLGCRCVDHDPWITTAESSELTLALLATGDRRRAERLFSRLQQYRDADGGYWTGYVFPDDAFWPEEKTTWTAAAVLLAADALTRSSPAWNLFACANTSAPAGGAD